MGTPYAAGQPNRERGRKGGRKERKKKKILWIRKNLHIPSEAPLYGKNMYEMNHMLIFYQVSKVKK